MTVQNTGPVLTVADPRGGAVRVPVPQFRCLVQLPGGLFPKDAVIDTGAPITWFPENVWRPLRDGVDFEWLGFPPGVPPPVARISSWQFTYRMVRFLAPLTLMDYSTMVDRPDVVAAFAAGNPPAYRTSKAPPPVIVGLWGGLLEGGRLAVGRDPAGGQVTGELEFP